MRLLCLTAVILGQACQITDRTRECSSSADCFRTASEMGECIDSPVSESRWCAYPDPECGLRYGQLAGDGLAGTCATTDPAPDGGPDAAGPDGGTPGETLTVTPMGMGRGAVISVPAGVDCGDDCNASFPTGTPVELSAVPLAGSRFDGWGGDCSGASATCTVEMTAPRLVDATFGDVLSWQRMVGDTGQDEGRAVALRSADIVAVGSFSGTVIFGGIELTSDGPNPDVFVVNYTPSGMVFWARRYGGPGTDVATAVTTISSSSTVVVAGHFDDTIDFGGGAETSNGGSDIFIAVLSGADGSALFSRTMGGAGDDAALGVAADSAGNVVVTGSFAAAMDFGGGVRSGQGSKDIFVAKYMFDLAWVWDRSYGSGGIDEGRAVVVDSLDGIVVTGSYTSTVNFGGPTPALSAGAGDIFVLRLDDAGAFTWLQRYGSGTNDIGRALAIDPAGAIIVGGEFSNTLSFGGPDHTPAGATDGFVLKLTSGGTTSWAVPIAATGADSVHGVAAGADDIFAVGQFEGALDLGRGSHVAAGPSDGFIVKLATSDGSASWTNATGGTAVDAILGVALSPVGPLSFTGQYAGALDLGDGVVDSAGMNDLFVATSVP